MNRIWNVVRLHLANRWGYLGTPWVIVAVTFVISYLVWLVIWNTVDQAGRSTIIEGTQLSGAIAAIFVYLLVVAAQSMTVTFPFAQGYSVTRREFYLGTSLLFVLVSALNAVIFTALGLLEWLTNGWGIQGSFFTIAWFGGDWLQRGYMFFALQLFFMFLGASVATIYLRWRRAGMVVFWIGFAAVLVSSIALVTSASAWPALGAWFAASGIVGVASWTILLALVAAAFGFAVMRRAAP